MVERQPCKLKVLGSIPSGGCICVLHFESMRLGKLSVALFDFVFLPLRVYSSAVERLTADQQVPGSNPGAPSFEMNSEAMTALSIQKPQLIIYQMSNSSSG